MGKRSLQVWSIAIISVMVVMLAACQQSQVPVTGASSSITIHAKDFSYDMPSQIPAGYVTLEMVNDGQEPHQAQFFRLNDDVTMDQFMAAAQQGPEAILPLVTAPGGPGVVEPGASEQVTLQLTEGQYVAVCFVDSPDGKSHIEKGMLASFQVVSDTSGSAATQEPQSDQTVTLKDFTFGLPSSIQSGAQTWKVTNQGPEPHEMGILKLADGKTMQDFGDYMQNPSGTPPFSYYGGMQALSVGSSGWIHLDLKPGNYALICFVPDPATGKPHVELGMLSEFTVQ